MSYTILNESTSAFFPQTLVPFAQGSFKKAYRGYYTDGPRQGQECVAKIFITPSIFNDHYFQIEMAVVRRTQRIIEAWNAARIIGMPVVLSVPAIWTFTPNGGRMLVEPFIRNFQKFNDNSGRVYFQGSSWSDALQALSHFSYHYSHGQALLCDVQGGAYVDRL